ncbi:3-phenylpropionate/cinnamic acid dioxygenase subunit beta [Novosphingobium colocasiae]|uniref:Ring-hydroxylating dioxygenase subunit beta n=1 Tax=Novosphingobium colocasiae TaxID=1256513 RepID=A0A918PGX2_9SPHN|nr:3-phenylpropionate/cinnamic acid dioxygenase subunit beta [Novosphingobium colocasiae]GGZ05527.1 ring-hydroxylating dioxygenase subunit beta [Novosphingobium colocasiae]
MSAPSQDLLARMALTFEAQQFLYAEARLLDTQNYKAWLELVTDDIHYWAPVVESRERRHRAGHYVAAADESAYFDDTRATLGMRVARLGFPGAWAEVPPSRMTRLISNVEVGEQGAEDIPVRSCFYLFRSRLETEEDSYHGVREDVLRRVDGELRLARRKIIFAQSVLTARSITTFL